MILDLHKENAFDDYPELTYLVSTKFPPTLVRPKSKVNFHGDADDESPLGKTWLKKIMSKAFLRFSKDGILWTDCEGNDEKAFKIAKFYQLSSSLQQLK